MFAQAFHIGVREKLPIAQITPRTEVILGSLDIGANGSQHLERFGRHFWPNSVAANHRKFHYVRSLSHRVDMKLPYQNKPA